MQAARVVFLIQMNTLWMINTGIAELASKRTREKLSAGAET